MPKTVQQTAPAAWNAASKRPNADEFHENNLRDGFSFFTVNMNDETTAEQIVSLQNKIKALDEKANQIDERTGRRITTQKPYFRYTSIQPDGTEKVYGGGWYLYTGWSDVKDKKFQQNTKPGLKGKAPIYFRAKNAIKNSKVPNFSIQWKNVYIFYYKFPVETPYVIKEGNKVITISPGLFQN